MIIETVDISKQFIVDKHRRKRMDSNIVINQVLQLLHNQLWDRVIERT